MRGRFPDHPGQLHMTAGQVLRRKGQLVAEGVPGADTLPAPEVVGERGEEGVGTGSGQVSTDVSALPQGPRAPAGKRSVGSPANGRTGAEKERRGPAGAPAGRRRRGRSRAKDEDDHGQRMRTNTGKG
ncbi:hypothetical protein GCM10010238_23270 [Streptomyces griseoviridis]|uniref:Uncharacterized protein n=1 Tax=Streptomyces griseoviridis TaxID=45398 RepID=A0A918GG08_STRGD|nr:hypothetical protein GCM10010238_23270 [Streptomyces niveoruber]